MRTDRREIAVALHDVEPATFERVALIRDWLADQGIGRATLLVVPAPDLHPLQDRSEPLVAWLDERRRTGDAIAQHGLRDRCDCRPSWTPLRPLSRRCPPDAEFATLSAEDTRRAVESGWRILRLAGLEPAGFVAPAYAYTPALHAALPRRFSWWAAADRIYRPEGPAFGVATSTAVFPVAAPRRHQPLTPLRTRLRAATAGRVLRLDLRPADLDRPRQVAAVERVLAGARGRVPVTLGEIGALGV
jgi:predicted deacetylase